MSQKKRCPPAAAAAAAAARKRRRGLLAQAQPLGAQPQQLLLPKRRPPQPRLHRRSRLAGLFNRGQLLGCPRLLALAAATGGRGCHALGRGGGGGLGLGPSGCWRRK
jgi:hypothetical protein